MLNFLQKVFGSESIKQERPKEIAKGYTCHGCKYLEGHMSMTLSLFFARCGQGTWEGDRIINIGQKLYKPTTCLPTWEMSVAPGSEHNCRGPNGVKIVNLMLLMMIVWNVGMKF